MPTPSPDIHPFSDDLLAQLVLVEVLEPSQIDAVRDDARNTGADASDNALADFLVSRGLLTPYQADRAIAGEADRLTVGPYLLLEPLASHTESVYHAVRRSDRKPYVVQLLPSGGRWNLLSASDQVAAFAINPPHPVIVPLSDQGDESGDYYLAWPQVEGESVQYTVEKNGPMDPSRAAQFAARVADALADSHRRGIVHGYLMPSNLLIVPDGSARVLGLGIGAVRYDNSNDPRLPQTWLEWAAPEVQAEPVRLTPAGDSYSLGRILYWLLSGTVPVAERFRNPISVKSLRPSIPIALSELVSRLMRRDPTARPADLAAIQTELNLIAESNQATDIITLSKPKIDESTGPPTPPPNLPRPRGSRPELGSDTPAEIGHPGEAVTGSAINLPERPTRKPFWKRMTQSVLPWGLLEPIQASVYGPRGLTHASTTPILVISHCPEVFHQLQALSARYLPGCALLAACQTAEPVPKGGEVWVHLAVEGAGAVVAPPLIKFPWSLESNVSTFNVSIPSWSKPSGHAAGHLIIGLNGYQVAELQFELAVVLPTSEEG